MTSPAIFVTREAVQDQLGEAYGRFNEDAWTHFVAMLQSVQRPEDVALHVQQYDSNRWTVTICTSDCVGALSIISGMFAAHRLDITKADIFTLDFCPASQLPRPQVRRRRKSVRSRLTTPAAPRRRILDVLEVHSRSNADPPRWDQFQDDLAYLVGLLVKDEQAKALEQIIQRISTIVEVAKGQEGQLLPMSMELDNELSPRYTLLTLRSPDIRGFLFAFSNALAILKVNIGHAEIRTIEGEVQDKFWLTDRGGGKIIREDQPHELRVAAALIKHFTYLLPRSSNPAQALLQFNALAHQMLGRSDWTDELRNLESPAVLATLADLMGVSQFLWEDFLRMQHQNLFPVVVDIPSLDQGKSLEQLRGELEGQVGGLPEHDDQVRELNRFKDREMFRIDLRHITGGIGFREFSEELSDLAQVIVGETAQLAHVELELRFGIPTLQDGQRCPWCICALGKFGGRELGFGSDIEMIVVYQDEGATTGPTVIENSRYFGDFVRECLRILSTRREGIFEVDLRLRPYGSDGPLASTLKGLEDYYSPKGGARQFERMALVKLRPVAGDGDLSAQVVWVRDAFVYSGNALDLENILHLRLRQASELVPSGMISAKYSLGGLVDLEYFVQAWQIAVGCLDTNVRVSNTLEGIAQLYKSGKMPQALAQQLAETYGFSRRLIDALRVVRGHAKDLTIPDTSSPEFAYLTRRLRYDSTIQLEEVIASQMGVAKNLWARGIAVG